MVQGSLPLLIPHEPLHTGHELLARVRAMHGVHDAVDSAPLRLARHAMLWFARRRVANVPPVPCDEDGGEGGGGEQGGVRVPPPPPSPAEEQG